MHLIIDHEFRKSCDLVLVLISIACLVQQASRMDSRAYNSQVAENVRQFGT